MFKEILERNGFIFYDECYDDYEENIIADYIEDCFIYVGNEEKYFMHHYSTEGETGDVIIEDACVKYIIKNGFNIKWLDNKLSIYGKFILLNGNRYTPLVDDKLIMCNTDNYLELHCLVLAWLYANQVRIYEEEL